MMLSMPPLAATGASKPEVPAYQPDALSDRTAAERLYPDAPAGVDPIVTGPVSQDFRDRQRTARCDEAEWPDIPIECYP